jgi:hypothetical protein
VGLGDAGTQPMTRAHLTITYNGELYNFRALRHELAAEFMFESETDTEVVLRAWQKWGPAALQRFRGMFTFAIWDQRAHSLIGTGLVVAERHPVILNAPFLSPIREASAAGAMLRQHLRARSGAPNDLPVVTVWLDSSPEVIRERMIARGAQRDHPKLTDWQAYRRDVLIGGVREQAHTVCDVVIGS